MKNLLLIGDSIRAGYDKSVKKTLEGRANVILTADSARFSSYLLRVFHEYLKDIKGEEIDLIHWNAGLWDCLCLFGEDVHTPIEIYAYYIDRICVRIKKLCPNATVIFATSTAAASTSWHRLYWKCSPGWKSSGIFDIARTASRVG